MEALWFILYVTDNYYNINTGKLKGQKRLKHSQRLNTLASILFKDLGEIKEQKFNSQRIKVKGRFIIKATSWLMDPKNKEISPNYGWDYQAQGTGVENKQKITCHIKKKYKVKQGLKTDFIMMTKLSYFICVCPM